VNVINVNNYNLQYLLNIRDYNSIIIYYYSFLIINNLNNNILYNIYIDGFTYQYLLNIPNDITKIYCNLMINIIDILKFKNILDDNGN
jgi:hypothetical protein